MQRSGRQSEWLIAHLPRSGVVQQRLPNGRLFRLWSRGDDWVSNQVFWRGWRGYEAETSSLFYHLATRAETVFDIGAHVGFFTVLAAPANPQARVFAFEPMPPVRARLEINLRLNRLQNVRCQSEAVGETPGAAEFYHIREGVPTSSSLSQDFMQGFGDFTHTKVQVLRLDDFVAENHIERVDLIKIDTESTEPAALRGLQTTLQRDTPDIICEVLAGTDTGGPLQELLEPLGYRFFLLTHDGPQQHETIVPSSDPNCMNYWFTTRDDTEIAQFTRAAHR